MMNIDINNVPDHTRRMREYDYFRILENRRIRYYGKFRSSKTMGKTIGRRTVTEVNGLTGEVLRTWQECYDINNRVNQIHPKRPKDIGHIEIDPETGKEIKRR